jgi:hypothetical protein
MLNYNVFQFKYLYDINIFKKYHIKIDKTTELYIFFCIMNSKEKISLVQDTKTLEEYQVAWNTMQEKINNDNVNSEYFKESIPPPPTQESLNSSGKWEDAQKCVDCMNIIDNAKNPPR